MSYIPQTEVPAMFARAKGRAEALSHAESREHMLLQLGGAPASRQVFESGSSPLQQGAGWRFLTRTANMPPAPAEAANPVPFSVITNHVGDDMLRRQDAYYRREAMPQGAEWVQRDVAWKRLKSIPLLAKGIDQAVAGEMSRLTGAITYQNSIPAADANVVPTMAPAVFGNPMTYWARPTADAPITRPFSPQPVPPTAFQGERGALRPWNGKMWAAAAKQEAQGQAMAGLLGMGDYVEAGLGGFGALTPEQEQAQIDKAVGAAKLALGVGVVGVLVAFVLKRKLS